MNFKHFKKIRSVKDPWLDLEIKGLDTYQSYLFNEICYKYRVSSITNIRNGNIKCDFIVGYENNIPVCIAPLVIDKKPEKVIRLLGHGTNVGYLDFIYNDPQYVPLMQEHICEIYGGGGYGIDFIFVKERSPLVNLFNHSQIFNNYAVYIDSYDIYFKSLSKHTRQNLRTAYNRICKDDLTYRMIIMDHTGKDFNDVLNRANCVYCKRMKDWKEIAEISKYKRSVILHRDVVYNFLRNSNAAKLAVLMINNNLAAFFIAIDFNNKKGVYIPRLAIDVMYSRYSPGMILINEYLKNVRSTETFIFDLCRGDEGYKTMLNGRISKTYRLSD